MGAGRKGEGGGEDGGWVLSMAGVLEVGRRSRGFQQALS